MFGSPNSELNNTEYKDNTVSYFDQTAALNFESFGGYRPHIEAIETCGTLKTPITDMAMQIAFLDFKTGEFVNRTNYPVFGNTTVEPPVAGGGLFGFGGGEATSDGKVCKEIFIDKDDYIVYAEIAHYKNQITKMIFGTKKAKVLPLGFDVSASKSQLFRFPTDGVYLTGFRGWATTQPDDEKFMSQISFILWKEECFDQMFVLYVIIGAAVLFVIFLICVICSCCCKNKNKENRVEYMQDTPRQ